LQPMPLEEGLDKYRNSSIRLRNDEKENNCLCEVQLTL